MERACTPAGAPFEYEIIPYPTGETRLLRHQKIERCWGDDCMKLVKFDCRQSINISLRTLMKSVGWRAIPYQPDPRPGMESQFECHDCQARRFAEFGPGAYAALPPPPQE